MPSAIPISRFRVEGVFATAGALANDTDAEMDEPLTKKRSEFR